MHACTTLTDEDVKYSFLMWINNPDFIGRIFMNQADRLGYTEEEKQAIFIGISRTDITKLITFHTHGE